MSVLNSRELAAVAALLQLLQWGAVSVLSSGALCQYFVSIKLRVIVQVYW